MRYLFFVYIILLQLLCGCAKPTGLHYTYIERDGLVPKPVYYDVLDGMAIVEGDILLGTVEEVEAIRVSVEGKGIRKGAMGVKSKRRFWDGGKVPFTFESSLENTERVTDALLKIERSTNLRFVDRVDEQDYVSFRSVEKGCFAAVGRQGGQQIVSLEKDCSTGNTVHEILHAMGLWHEQSRLDRDQFVKIHWENISDTHKHNFEQQLNDGMDIGEYDYDSIMHYGPLAFSKNGRPTILRIDGSSMGLGNRRDLSKKDIAALAELYPE